MLASLGGAAGLVGALLYYFGWARSSTVFSYFGVDVDMVGLSFQDYLLRSVGSAFWPLLVVGVAALAAVAVHRLVARSRWVAAIGIVSMAAGSVGIATGLLAVARLITFRTPLPVVPAILLTGTLLVVYGWTAVAPRFVAARGRSRSPAATVGTRAPITLVVLLLTFWTVSNFAGYWGTRGATAIAAHLEERPGVVVFSSAALDLHGEGVTTARVGGSESTYTWCYGGLRLLIDADGKHFLLPEKWQLGRDPLLVLRDGDGVRLEYYRSTTASTCP
jgi:hypothetical protein